MSATDVQLAAMSQNVYGAGGGDPVSSQWERILNVDEANLVGLAHFFQRPANARITRQSLAAIG